MGTAVGDAPSNEPLPEKMAKIYYFVPVARHPALNMVASFERARAEAQSLGMAHFTLPEWNGFSVDIANKRNVAGSKFLLSDMDWLMMVDDDMDFRHDPAAIAKMIAIAEAEKADIVAPMMVRRDPPHWVCYNEKRHVPDDTLRGMKAHVNEEPIDCTGHVGTGCILIRKRVFQELTPPWFQTVPTWRCRTCQPMPENDKPREKCERCHGSGKDPEGVWIEQGEDTYFCRRAIDAGFKCICAAGVIVGHLGESSLTIHDSIRVGFPILYAENVIKQMQAKMREMQERGLTIPDDIQRASKSLIAGNGHKPDPAKELVIASK